MIDWILDAGLQRQAQIGLNKGEAHHALKRAISFHRRGEIRDRSGEGQHYRIAGMNLLAAIIIFWNTMKLGEVVNTRAASGTHIAPDLLAHVSPLGWEHINLTGECLAVGMGTHQSNRGISLAQILSVGFRPLPQTPPTIEKRGGIS